MIQSFRCKQTQRLYYGESVPRFVNIRRVAERKLAMLHYATKLEDLKLPPSNFLEALKGDRLGQYSIRINVQWRVCFKFAGGNATDVEIVDYH